MFSKKYDLYPSEILSGRIEVEGAIIGCLMKDMLLIEDIKLSKDNFATIDGIFYFSIIEKLRKKNINTITEMDILSNFNDKVFEQFNDRGGIGQIKLMTDTVDVSNFDSYIDDLYKYNSFISLYDMGYNLTSPTMFEGEEVIPLELFKKIDCEQMVDFYENQLNSLNVTNLKKGVKELEIDIDDAFIESCMSGENTGVPIDMAGEDMNGEPIYAFPRISQQIQGLLNGTLSMLGGYSSVGKSTMIIYIIMALIHRGEKILIISNEQDEKPFKMNFLMWILTNKLRYYKLTKKDFMSGKATEEDLKMVREAQRIWKEEFIGKVFFVTLPNADNKIVKKKIREYHLTKGVTTFLYDTFKADLSGDKNDKTWLDLIKDSRELHELARKYDMIGLATIQLAMNSLGTLFLTPNVLSQSKQVVEILENLLLMRNVYPEELDPEDKRFYCKPFKYEKDSNGKWKEKKIDIDKTKQYRMLFISKCRNGENSQSGNYAMLLSFDGQHGGVREYCLCRPKTTNINK